jgi:hypothetical protein
MTFDLFLGGWAGSRSLRRVVRPDHTEQSP